MEKLIELLLECKPQIHYLDKPKGLYDKRYGICWYKREGDIGGWFSEEVIISKKFGFIKRLVDNDKINTKDNDLGLFASELGIPVGEDTIIMQLAVSKHPIKDLISYLK